MIGMPKNNVFLSKEELPIVIAALNNAIRDNKGLSSEALDILIGARNEVQYVYQDSMRLLS